MAAVGAFNLAATAIPAILSTIAANRNRGKLPDVPKTGEAAPRGGGQAAGTGQYSPRFAPFNVRPSVARTLGMPSRQVPGKPGPQTLAGQRYEDQAKALQARDTAVGTLEGFRDLNEQKAGALSGLGTTQQSQLLRGGSQNFRDTKAGIAGASRDADTALQGTLMESRRGLQELKDIFTASMAQFKTDYDAFKNDIQLDVSQKMAEQSAAIQGTVSDAKEEAMANIMASPGDMTYKLNAITASNERIDMAGAKQIGDGLRKYNQEMVQYLGDIGRDGLMREADMYTNFQTTFTSAINESRRVAGDAWKDWSGTKEALANLNANANQAYDNWRNSVRANNNVIQSTATQLALQGDLVAAQGISNLQLISPELAPILEAELAYNLTEQDTNYNREMARWATEAGLDASVVQAWTNQLNLAAQYDFAQRQTDQYLRQQTRQFETGAALQGASIGVGAGTSIYGANKQAQALEALTA